MSYFGMTKRELFAAMAMQGICSNTERLGVVSPKSLATIAVLHADALIEELNK